MAAAETARLPGYGEPLNSVDHRRNDERFPSLLADEWSAPTLTIREVFMLWCVEQITNKPNWNTKVFDDAILAKWRAEVDQAPWQEVTGFRDGGPCSENMWNFIVKELQHKARLYEQTGMIPVFDAGGVVIKSDTLVDEQLKIDLRRAAAVLEDIPEDAKDWHPRSDGKVLDLVHPSLWPLIYGRSRCVADGSLTLDNCLDKCGIGEVIPKPDIAPSRRDEGSWHNRQTINLWSTRFQWLPCEVDIACGTPKILTYINNIHPTTHRDLYGVIERFIGKSLPLWDQVYRWPMRERKRSLRIICNNVTKECTVPEACDDSEYGCDPASRPVDDGEEPRPEEDEYWRLPDDHPLKVKDEEWFARTHPCDHPEPGTFEDAPKITLEDVPTDGFFGIKGQDKWLRRNKADTPPRSRIQVIVKLANIHLTPEKPSYPGGSWHIEGQMNERICATALYYYDNDNITPSHLAFRTAANGEDLMMNLGYEQGDMRSIGGTFAIDPEGNTLQNIGRTSTPEGRLLAFPNLYQHRVAPFELADPTRPGHRKILALFLVDPATPVISTAHVAPQQAAWWLGEGGISARVGETGRLPREIVDMVSDSMDWPVSLDEAKAARLDLMDERTQMEETADSLVTATQWNFCEH